MANVENPPMVDRMSDCDVPDGIGAKEDWENSDNTPEEIVMLSAIPDGSIVVDEV